MATKVEQILGDLQTRLNATAVGSVSKPTNLVVNDSRRKVVEAGQLPWISVIPVKDARLEDPQPSRTRGMDRRCLFVALFHRCIGTDITNETLRAWSVQQVLADPSLGGLVINVQEDDTEWTAEVDGSNDFSEAPMLLAITYTRLRGVL